jgi:hypothetical protein
MRIIACARSTLAGVLSLALAATASAQIVVSVRIGAPPELPVYEQPPLPAAGYLWAPGYWAYSDDGYYWVPGTWVLAPEPGMLWTPGYWSWSDNGYVWNEGYWAPEVGFYGGINYGYGYGGDGYEGGYWDHGALYYNRSVNHISNTTNITNVYNKTVINNTTVTNVSYNGGSGGIPARPTPVQLAVVQARHVPPTGDQTQHEHAAASNRDQLASTNHGKPAVVATAKPGEFAGQGVVTESRVSHTYRAVSTGDVANAKKTEAPPVANKAETPPVVNKTEAPPVTNKTEAPPVAKKAETPPPTATHPNNAAPPPPPKRTPPPPVQPKAEEHPRTDDQSKEKPQPKADDQHKNEVQPKSPPPQERDKQPPPDKEKKPESPLSTT